MLGRLGSLPNGRFPPGPPPLQQCGRLRRAELPISSNEHVQQPLEKGSIIIERTLDLRRIFDKMPVTSLDRTSDLYLRYEFIAVQDSEFETRQRYLDRVYIGHLAEGMIVGALSSGLLSAWVDLPGQRWTKLIPSTFFSPGKFCERSAVGGIYREKGRRSDVIQFGDEDRAKCDGCNLWSLDEDWPAVRAQLIARREQISGEVIPEYIKASLNRSLLPDVDAIFAQQPPIYMVSLQAMIERTWSLYEAVAWIGSRDQGLVDRQQHLDQPGTRPEHVGAVVWSRLEQSLNERIAAGLSALTANQARDRLRDACERGLVQASGVPADRGDRRVIPAGDFTKAVIWEGKGESLHRSVAGKAEAPRWSDLRFDAENVRALATEWPLTTHAAVATPAKDARKPPVRASSLRDWVRDRNKEGWSQDRIVKEAAAAFPLNEVPGRPTLRDLDADVREKMELPPRSPGRGKKGR